MHAHKDGGKGEQGDGGRARRVRVRTFEPLLRVEVDLLRLRDLFQDLLDDHSVVVAHFAVVRSHCYDGGILQCATARTHLGVISMW